MPEATIVGVVVLGAVLLGVLSSLALWWCVGRSKAERKISRHATEDLKFLEKLNNAQRPPDFKIPTIFYGNSEHAGNGISSIQPNPSSSTMSTSSDCSTRSRKLDSRFGEGKVAKIMISIYYSNKTKELVVSIHQVKHIHSSIDILYAYVQMRRGGTSKLVPVRLQNKGSRLIGTGSIYKMNMTQEEILGTVLNFYMWSADSELRNYQAGVCTFSFENKVLSDFTKGNGYTTHGDFKLTTEKDTRNCAVLTLTLRYNNRSGKLLVTIHSLSKVPKVGWRGVATGVAENAILEPSPMVKVTLSREDEESTKEVQKTTPVKGYNPEFERLFSFDVSLNRLPHVKLSLEISYTNMKMTHIKLGTVEFSADSTGAEGEHWRQMEQVISKDCGVKKEHYIRNKMRNSSSRR